MVNSNIDTLFNHEVTIVKRFIYQYICVEKYILDQSMNVQFHRYIYNLI